MVVLFDSIELKRRSPKNAKFAETEEDQDGRVRSPGLIATGKRDY
jgi:hypothetical protein